MCDLAVFLGVQNLQQPSPLPVKQETTRVVSVSPPAGAEVPKRSAEFHSDEMFDSDFVGISNNLLASVLQRANHSIRKVDQRPIRR